MNFLRLHIQIPEDYQEILIAELFDLDFDGFEQDGDLLIASVNAHQFDDFKREQVEQIVMGIPDAELLKEEVIPDQNWNQQWEETIQPQTIGTFYVRPTWSDDLKPDSDLTEILIDPKMAFGTGYHQTTRLVLEFLDEVIEKGDDVLDAGTGTGILGIAALKLGAASVFGFDIDEWSKTNAEENISLNGVSNFEVVLGSIGQIPEDRSFDLILANINRNALASMMPELIPHLKRGGKILLSGLLETDEDFMLKQESLKPLTHVETRKLGEWIALLMEL